MTFEEMLSDWEVTAKELKRLKAKEAKLRQTLFDAAFPAPKEGTNQLELADGRIIKGTYKISRTVDADAARVAMMEMATMAEQNNEQVSLDGLFKWKPSLGKTAYDGLPDRFKLVADQAITAKPGTPGLEVT